MTEVNEWNQKIIAEFRERDGVVGGMFQGTPLLILHSTGARSGAERLNPLAYQRVGDGWAVFASKAGAPTNPDWYHNVRANPDVSIEIGTETMAARARIADGDERDRIFDAQKAAIPTFAEYEQSAGERVIPVVVLEPA